MKYRKKPVVVEAIRWNGMNLSEVQHFVGDVLKTERYDAAWEAGAGPPMIAMTIHTLEGDHTVSEGDYIIKGVAGEFYPCKPDIFAQTYETVGA